MFTTRPLYAGLLVAIALPVALFFWASRAEANVALPVYGDTPVGFIFAGCGVALIAASLWRGLTIHWIYAGLAAICPGISMIEGSAAGLWLVAPTLVLACFAEALARNPIRLLPPDDLNRPSIRDGIRFVLVVVVPWLALFEFTSHMRLHGTSFGFPFEDHMRVLPWTAFVYETSYLTVTFAPTWTRTNRQLRQLMISAWSAMALVFPIYWVMPSSAPRRPMIDDSWIAHLLHQERGLPPTAAFPSFHVLWAVFVGRLWPRWLGVGYTALIAISCVTTGMHYIPDAMASLLLAPLLLEPERRLWAPLKRLLAPGQWRRVVAAILQLGILLAAVGQGREWKVLVTWTAGLAGLLINPFAFPISLTAAGLASLFFEERWILLAAYCLNAPWMRVLSAGSRLELVLNVLLGLVLCRLWWVGSPLPIVGGVYLIGHGLARLFQETLPLYRWIGVCSMIAGAIVTTL
jgi:hypothetical protein